MPKLFQALRLPLHLNWNRTNWASIFPAPLFCIRKTGAVRLAVIGLQPHPNSHGLSTKTLP